MEIIDAIILGIIQGLTEFLPVSSSGHLELGKAILGADALPEESLLFTVVLHFATALSTMVVFRKDVLDIFRGLFQFKWNEETQFALKIVVSMIPAALVGFFLQDYMEVFFDGAIIIVGIMLIITAILLYLADLAKTTEKAVSYRSAFVIGLAQMVAMLPGISRSGATISAAVLLGIDKTRSARFSFLMVVPLIIGKMAKDIFSGEINFQNDETIAMGAGFLAAFVAGLAACTWMIKLVRQSKLTYFAMYCLLVGLIAIGWSIWG
ncbi:undecaprenyl-diphosphate phosphatase [Allomuricauda sp. SCSIO 65647]|uniref:undecaprenyl-diphosphate phosphatase n=1 Tax=Allomuricauda sp. SCSIO 65647 TaxID=2908843 RepID=UPI001F2A7EBA|nr:undecaprenyl-diphosphate phosphatase [Muricauda sp. SCSIO 65647]UJH66178.1 undecaprenyl-diphosphate phosphatase [Muricauda sp. SCSIO 65647]